MIVKNEAHIIEDTLNHLDKYIKFDYWVISDTGSTDNTKEIIKDFFKAKGIPGELQEEAWQDFGYNRTKEFEGAYGKADYALVWDADDEIYGDFKMPENLDADCYKFIFGNAEGMRYSRPQLFNMRKRWCYKGVLHEYANCLEPCGPNVDVPGNYYFISGRRGDRSKDPNKYLKDAMVLEKASAKALAEGDPLYNRYIFYCAQSYNSCNMHEKAIEFYKKALTLPLWIQEKYVSCMEIYDQYVLLNRANEGLYYLVESYQYDPTRVECYYRLIKHYCINGPVEVAFAYYGLIQEFFENRYDGSVLGEKLFARRAEYDFYLPYYMIIVADRMKRYKTSVKMCEIVFKNKFVAPEWWMRNLFHNMQFCINDMPADLGFLESMLAYVEKARQSGVTLEPNHYHIIGRAVDRYRSALGAPNQLAKQIQNRPLKPTIMLTITTCKRLDLFLKTVNSMLNCWTDIGHIDYFYCVDDNSSEEDRKIMRESFPFFDYYMKGPEERGHRESMNVIWSKLAEVKPQFWIHLEDDWLYFKKEAYVGRALEVLTKYESKGVHQVVFNKNYGLMFSDLDRVGGIPLDKSTVLHEKREGLVGKNCGYWPHYSLQPSMMRTKVALELGNYNSPNKFFERDYADRYFAKGHMTAFFDSIYSIHIGKQHWEKEGMNAYALNEVSQFNGAAASTPAATTPAPAPAVLATPVKTNDGPLPRNGTMRQHLDWFLERIKSGKPFGLIRPSDGERTVMLGQTLTNCDHWTFKEGGSLQKMLLEAVKIYHPDLYIGIPCNTCNKPWNCTPAIYKDFIEKFHVPVAQRTYANVFGNSNWSAFIDFLKSYEKGFYLVTSGTTPTEAMKIKGRHIIDAKLVNRWDTEGSTETERVLRYMEDKKGELILFSAGPLSKVWIPLCMRLNPDNMYVDVGGSIDIFTKGASNRFYTNQAHPFAKEACQFRVVEGLQGYDYVFKTSIDGFRQCEDKATLFKSFRRQHAVYGFTDNGDRPPDQEAVTIAKELNETMYNEYMGLLKGRAMVGYEGSTVNYAAYTNLDSRHVMMSILLFSALPEPISTIVEIGGGFGNWLYLNRAKDFEKWITVDLPHVGELQRYYLGETGVDLKRWRSVSAFDYKEVEAEKVDLVIGAHSLSELAIEIFEDYFQRVVSKSKYFFYCYHTSRPTPALIEAKNQMIQSQFRLLKSAMSEGGNVANCLYVNTAVDSAATPAAPAAPAASSIAVSEALQKKKNLIYMSAFGTEEYYKLLELTLISIKAFSDASEGTDFLVFTSSEFEPRIHELNERLGLPLKTTVVNTIKTPHDAAACKMRIFEYADVDQYSKFLFIDIDIIVQGSLSNLFDLCVQDKLYTVNQATVGSHPGLGSTLFDFSTDNRAAPAINTGTMLFNNCPPIKKLFADINTHMAEFKESGKELPPCYEQPFVNFHAIRATIHDLDTLTPLIKLCQMDPVSPLVNKQVVINHFFDNVKGSTKSKRMTDYFVSLLRYHKSISLVSKSSDNLLKGKQYVWGSGSIMFDVNNRLITTWVNGNYDIIGSNVAVASWAGYDHFIIFNSNLSKYTYIRLNDGFIGNGSAQQTTAA